MSKEEQVKFKEQVKRFKNEIEDIIKNSSCSDILYDTTDEEIRITYVDDFGDRSRYTFNYPDEVEEFLDEPGSFI